MGGILIGSGMNGLSALTDNESYEDGMFRMYDAHNAPRSCTVSHYEKAAYFLNDLKVDASLFTDPARGEDWLMTVENVYHALLAMEHQYAGTSPSPIPFWFSNTPLGVEYSEFIQLASKAPYLMERLKPTQKLAFFASLVGMITAACEDIAKAGA